MNVSKLTPIGNRILVSITKEEKQMIGAIVVPNGIEKPTEALVIDCGEEVHSVTQGENILISRNCGVTFENDGIEYRVLTPQDVLAVIK
jgi:co-chaperonin GroES (HSP10)